MIRAVASITRIFYQLVRGQHLPCLCGKNCLHFTLILCFSVPQTHHSSGGSGGVCECLLHPRFSAQLSSKVAVCTWQQKWMLLILKKKKKKIKDLTVCTADPQFLYITWRQINRNTNKISCISAFILSLPFSFLSFLSWEPSTQPNHPYKSQYLFCHFASLSFSSLQPAFISLFSCVYAWK